ncbi:HARBI1 [Mytilus edulis]|uniref:Putative nuclease HARBI1 n=1 Tax=Mytilus edulis TaxID=6550 RepID=A0A8S3R4Z3_MYTED|nr:HARBI1 [Mytilus edulis]
MRGDLERGTNKETALSVEQQVMIALRFHNKSTVSRVIDRVTDSLVAMKDDFISWPDNQRKNVIRAGFYEKAGFPNVVGCIDGTHIRITGPSIDEPAFVNRKGFHSINVQAICDHEGNLKHCIIPILCLQHASYASFFLTSSIVLDHIQLNLVKYVLSDP